MRTRFCICLFFLLGFTFSCGKSSSPSVDQESLYTITVSGVWNSMSHIILFATDEKKLELEVQSGGADCVILRESDFKSLTIAARFQKLGSRAKCSVDYPGSDTIRKSGNTETIMLAQVREISAFSSNLIPYNLMPSNMNVNEQEPSNQIQPGSPWQEGKENGNEGDTTDKVQTKNFFLNIEGLDKGDSITWKCQLMEAETRSPLEKCHKLY